MNAFVNWLLLGSLALMVIGFISVNVSNFLEWNYGICKKSGKPWIPFSTDSSGDIGYKDDCNNYLWIPYYIVRLADKIKHLRK